MRLLKKAQVLDKLSRGMSTAAVRCNHVVVLESRIRFLKKMKKRTEKALKTVLNYMKNVLVIVIITPSLERRKRLYVCVHACVKVCVCVCVCVR